MEWSLRGANAIVSLRCMIESGCLEDYWEDLLVFDDPGLAFLAEMDRMNLLEARRQGLLSDGDALSL